MKLNSYLAWVKRNNWSWGEFEGPRARGLRRRNIKQDSCRHLGKKLTCECSSVLSHLCLHMHWIGFDYDISIHLPLLEILLSLSMENCSLVWSPVPTNLCSNDRVLPSKGWSQITMAAIISKCLDLREETWQWLGSWISKWRLIMLMIFYLHCPQCQSTVCVSQMNMWAHTLNSKV